MTIKAMLGDSVGASIGAVMSPFTSIFGSIKKIITLIIILALVIMGGYWIWNYQSTMKRERQNTITVLENAASNAVVTTETVAESSNIKEMVLDVNITTKKDVKVKAEKKKAETKQEIVTIDLKFDKKLADKSLSDFAKADLERQRAREVSAVQIASIWDNYCDAVKSTDDSLIKTCNQG